MVLLGDFECHAVERVERRAPRPAPSVRQQQAAQAWRPRAAGAPARRKQALRRPRAAPICIAGLPSRWVAGAARPSPSLCWLLRCAVAVLCCAAAKAMGSAANAIAAVLPPRAQLNRDA